MAIAAWTWQDLSPEDGCAVVEYLAAASSLHDLTRLAAGNPMAQHRTARQLLVEGRARQVAGSDAEHALARAGSLMWRLDHDGPWISV